MPAEPGTYLSVLERRLDQAIEHLGEMIEFLTIEMPEATGTIEHLKNLKATFEATKKAGDRYLHPPEESNLELVSGWVVEVVGHCTCGSGGYSPHEQYCGYEPICSAAEWFVYRMGEHR